MANFDAINDSIRAIDWPSTPTQDLNSACAKFTSIFLHVINSNVPSKTVSDQPRPPLFFTRSSIVEPLPPNLICFFLIIGLSGMLSLLKSSSLSPNFSIPSPTHLKGSGLTFRLYIETRILFLLSHPFLVLSSQIMLASSFLQFLYSWSYSPCYCPTGPLWGLQWRSILHSYTVKNICYFNKKMLFFAASSTQFFCVILTLKLDCSFNTYFRLLFWILLWLK